MYALLTIVISLLALVGLLRLKVRIGRAMMLSSILLALLLGVTPGAMGRQLAAEWRQQPLTQTTPYLFVSLTALLLLVNVVGEAMKQIGLSERLVPAMRGLFRSRRAALAAIPGMMGMLPTPGGIMLSAPMVRAAGDKIGVDRGHLAAINYWFRHQWESVWPLFPAVPLIQGMLGVSAGRLIGHHLVLSLTGFAAGAVFLLLVGIPPRHKDDEQQTGPLHAHMRDFVYAFWPIAFTALLYVAFNVPPAAGILLAIFGMLWLHKVKPSRWGGIFKAANEPDMALLIFGALWFKLNLEAGGAVPGVVDFFAQMHTPPLLIVFLLPFIVTASTGVTMPTVAMTYPFLLAYIGQGDHAHLGVETLAFAAIVFGLAVSPIHLCVALSAGYFETSLTRIILKSLPAGLCVVAAGFALAILLR
jgi:integral membrane protein (TIGR00529 family)